MAGLLDLIRYVTGHPLNRGRRLAALARVFRWQCASRLFPGVVALPFVDDTHLFARRGMTGATGNWYCGLHEVHEMAFVLHVLRPDDLFVDVGANVGSYTVLASGAAKAETVAVEPVPATFRALRRNVLLNEIDGRVRLCHVGLADEGGVLRFSAALDTMNHVLGPGEDGPAVEVPVVRLDDLLEGRVPAVIKIDVEGYERFVLEGAARTLAAPDLLAVSMETNESGRLYGVRDAEIVSLVESHGFARHRYDALSRTLSADGADAPQGGNTLFVRDAVAVRARIAQAPRFRLVNGTI